MRVIYFTAIFALAACLCEAQEVSTSQQKPLFQDDPKGQLLPAGVPRMVDTNGNVVWINQNFTTTQYHDAASALLLDEANHVAMELQLEEDLPIVKSNIVETIVTPFGFNFINKTIGSIVTKHYCYYVSYGDKFSELGLANYDEICMRLRDRGSFPISKIDTNAAWQLANHWLSLASMDITGLNRDFKSHISLSPFWNSLAKLGDQPKKEFVPIYFIWWTNHKNDVEGHGNVAYVELYSPTKKLLQLSVSDPKYILRKPLVFKNINSFFPQTAPVETLPPVQPVVQPNPG